VSWNAKKRNDAQRVVEYHEELIEFSQGYTFAGRYC
jgi:hypothetical protein